MEEILAVDEYDGAFDGGLGRHLDPLETITPSGPCGRSDGEEVHNNYKAIGAVFQEPNGFLTPPAKRPLTHASPPGIE